MAESQIPTSLTLEQAVGQILRNLRAERKLKQIDVSVATNFAVRSLRTMEHGRQSMTIRSLDALAMFYELPIEDVLIRAKKLREELSTSISTF
jgi:transcriptional regulator with XRE-family HTH domain